MKTRSLLKRFAASPLLALVLRVCLGGLFVYAGVYKINYPGEFAETIASYQIVPYFLVNLTAAVLPWVELVCGALVILGIRPKAAALTLAGLLAVFALAVAVVLVRGIPIDCGCFRSMGDPVSWKTLLRDLVWLAMAVQVYCCDRLLHLENAFLAKVRGI